MGDPNLRFNMPLVAPAFRLPTYRYNHIRRLSIVLESEPESIKRFIPEPFEYVSNQYTVWLEHRVDEHPGPTPDAFPAPFDTWEASLDIPVSFRGLNGTHIPLMWVPATEQDFARALAGRELQGFGKKLSHFHWDERAIEGEVYARMIRNGVNVIDVHVKLTGNDVEIPTKPPYFGLKVFPRVDGTGFDLKKVTALDNWEYNAVISRGGEVVSLNFAETDEDPLYLLKPTRIVGAQLTVWTGAVHNPCGYELADLLAEEQAAAAVGAGAAGS
jgi:acetoacetate decarboxylase